MSHSSDAQTNNDGRHRILHAASALFALRGFGSVSISDVAESAGLVKSSIYHHFENKEALYLAVLMDVCRYSCEQMEAGAQGATWRERLRGATRALSHLTGPNSHVLSLILGGIAQTPEKHKGKKADLATPLRREFISVLVREITNGVKAGELRKMDPELSALALVGVVTAVLQSAEDSSSTERVDFAFDVFLQGVQRRKD
jgi:AcrR family transcriptional regulator